jgi:hypothetical protein
MSSGNKETAISLLSLEIIKSETKILRYHRATYSMHIPKHNGGVIGGSTLDLPRSLSNFRLLELQPLSGYIVMGFGQIYSSHH